MEDLLMEIVKAVVAVVIPYIGILVRKLIKEGIDEIENKKARELAIDVILFVEDKIGSDPGDDKLKFAVNILSNKLGYSKEKAEELVRSAYQKVFGQLKNE